MNRLSWIGLLGFWITVGTGCESVIFEPDPEPTPIHVFEDLWQGFDRYCGNFASRQVDWDAVYAEYRSQISDNMTDEQVFEVLSRMIYELKDPHVWLLSPAESFYTLDRLAAERNFRTHLVFKIVRESYLNNRMTTAGEGRLWYGRIPMQGTDGQSAGTAGYLYIRDFKGDRNDTWFDDLHAVLDSLRDTQGLILDLRENGGGNGKQARTFAGRFADQERLWIVSQTRNGPDRYDDFTEPFEQSVAPTGDWQYRKPVIVLTSRFTLSAGELFTLAMRSFPHVTVIGDTTAGTTGSVHERELINGWRYALSYQKTFDASGVNYDGVGIPPDIYQPLTATHIFGGIDPLIEQGLKAMRLTPPSVLRTSPP